MMVAKKLRLLIQQHHNLSIVVYITRHCKFENFKTDSTPDRKVYLSKTTNNAYVINLHALKSTSGNFNYPIASEVNAGTYNIVLIWC
ncbi:MAG: DM13 domain-containing protein [Bacteroidetes bacterium]|nr:DM13 domain-containing protein [Bacteroidota bacterium]